MFECSDLNQEIEGLLGISKKKNIFKTGKVSQQVRSSSTIFSKQM